MQFTKEQRIWLVQRKMEGLSYEEIRNNFFIRFRREAPTIANIRLLVRKFEIEGTVHNLNKERSGRIRRTRNEENAEMARALFEEQPNISIRKGGQALDVAPSTLHRLVRYDNNFFPYKYQKVDELNAASLERRLQFARNSAAIVPNLQQIWFTDESCYHLTGYVNKQNSRQWAPKLQNPHPHVDRRPFPQKIMVWGAMNYNHGVVMTIVPPGPINSEVYIRLLADNFIPVLEQTGVLQAAWFMQDGARAHTSRASMDFLRENFHNRVISNR